MVGGEAIHRGMILGIQPVNHTSKHQNGALFTGLAQTNLFVVVWKGGLGGGGGCNEGHFEDPG